LKKAESNQEVMECLFPQWRKLPTNVLIPLITRYDNADEPTVLSMLFLGDDVMLREFKIENNDGEDISITLYTKENKNTKEALDLLIDIEFVDMPSRPVMKTIIIGDNQSAQFQFVQALYEITKFYIFIADEDGRLLEVKEISWNAFEHDEVLKLLLKKEQSLYN
jgi:uncharacterized protein YihD (DUF1040 family)